MSQGEASPRDPISGFFYGGLINPKVQARVGLNPGRQARAILAGYELVFEPWVNLRPRRGGLVPGLVMEVDPLEVEAAYGRLGARYLPYPVWVAEDDGSPRIALCYIAPSMAGGPVDPDHVGSLLETAEALRFPEWHLAAIRRFLPAP